MASLTGNLHRPLSAMAALAVAAVSSAIPDKFSQPKPSESGPMVVEPNAAPVSGSSGEARSWVPRVSVSNFSGLSFTSTALKPLSNVGCPVANSTLTSISESDAHLSSIALTPPPGLLVPYQYAKLSIPAKIPEGKPSVSSSPSEVMYRWHLPEPSAYLASGRSECSSAKSQTVVVLLGWLGAKQKHLKRYAEWYTSRGFHVVTFTFPMAEVMSYKVGGKAEQDLESLASHLAGWVAEEHGKNLVFHTFSNTGWLTYGVILEKFQKQDPSLLENIKGCIVDSAPVAAPDPQVWASGFSAAFLKKHSVATKGSRSSSDSQVAMLVSTDSGVEPKPAVAETALLAVLEKFFEVVLNLPRINRRLSDVLDLLSSEQPKCPQLYIYSSADRVIPVKSVESFIEAQRRAGHEVRACDFISSPHVDHFRNHPDLYTSQLTTFLEDCVLTCCRDSF